MYTEITSGKYNGLSNYREFLIDDESDLINLPTSSSYGFSDGKLVQPCAVGSKAHVINQRKVYILNNKNEWKVLIDYTFRTESLAPDASDSKVADSVKIYCWGDSLTEGIGGHIKQADGVFNYPEYSYPKTLAESYNVVNCGARGENIPAIMARQGADPIVVGCFTIPADKTPVKIGELNLSTGVGLKTKSGATAQILRESESIGINPVTISGIKGTLYRKLENHFDADHTYEYYFVREVPGEAVPVPGGH